MADVNGFVDAIGKDVSATVVPKIGELADQISAKALADYGPKISAFASELVKDFIGEQAGTVRTFTGALIQELFARYRPELVGDLRATLVQNAIVVAGEGVRLDLKRRDTGAAVSSLDIPIAITIRVDDLAINIDEATIKLDLIR